MACKCGPRRSLGAHGQCLMCGEKPAGVQKSQAERLQSRRVREPVKKVDLDQDLEVKILKELEPFLGILTRGWLTNGPEARVLYFDPDTMRVSTAPTGEIIVKFVGRPCKSELEELGLKTLMAEMD